MKEVLRKLGFSSSSNISLRPITWGKDSHVYQIEDEQGHYALRVLPINRYEQFIQEQRLMLYVGQYGIPVPTIHQIVKTEEETAMLMEWAKGETLLHYLKESPKRARGLGYEFGKTQIQINELTYNLQSDWLVPNKREKRLLDSISLKHDALIHLDYHPLNVLSDGKEMTAILDWINAGAGDPQLDHARTYAILKLAGEQHLTKGVLEEFIDGWKSGLGITGFNSNIESWAIARTIRDMQ